MPELTPFKRPRWLSLPLAVGVTAVAALIACAPVYSLLRHEEIEALKSEWPKGTEELSFKGYKGFLVGCYCTESGGVEKSYPDTRVWCGNLFLPLTRAGVQCTRRGSVDIHYDLTRGRRREGPAQDCVTVNLFVLRDQAILKEMRSEDCWDSNSVKSLIPLRDRADVFGPLLVELDTFDPLVSAAANTSVARTPSAPEPLNTSTQPRSGRGSDAPTAEPTQTRTPQAEMASRGPVRVVVLEFSAPQDFDPSLLALLSDTVRAEALRATSGTQATVVARESIDVMLREMGSCVDDAIGECEIETGRNVGADIIITGSIQRVSDSTYFTQKIFEVETGRLLALQQYSAKTEDLFVEKTRESSRELVGVLRSSR